MYKVGLSSCGFELNEENFKKMQENGIEAIEISLKPEMYENINYVMLEKISMQYDIKLWSYHLPFMPFAVIDPSSTNEDVRKKTVEYFSELIKKGSDIGIDKFVIHPSAEPVQAAERNERLKYSMQSLDKLANVAYECGAYIAVEDLPRSCLGNTTDEILELISVNDKLRVCFDTNHLLKDDNIHFMEKLGKKIITVHISDYDFMNERHWLPGEGDVDWKAVTDKFEEIKYNGVWLYEIYLKCPKTIIRPRDLTFADFYKNAKSVFFKDELFTVGKRKEPLGMWE